MTVLKITRTPNNADLPLPRYATSGSAGFDLRACVMADKPTMLYHGCRLAIPTGFMFAVPNGYELQIRPRSGLALNKGVTVANSPGTLDSDYRGEGMVCLVNFGDEPFPINRGDRIAQAILAPVSRAMMIEMQELDATERGAGGFGHTGMA